jgi:hypothetical protein
MTSNRIQKNYCLLLLLFTGFGCGNIGADGRIILRWIFKKCDGGMERIDLPRERDR